VFVWLLGRIREIEEGQSGHTRREGGREGECECDLGASMSVSA